MVSARFAASVIICSGQRRGPVRAQSRVTRAIPMTAATSAHRKTNMSARTPSGGAPGSALRSTGIAKAMAAMAPISVASARHLPPMVPWSCWAVARSR